MLEKLESLNIGQVLKDEPLAGHTSFKIGGPCKYMCLPDSYENLSKLIKFLNEENEKYYVIGKGTNLLVADKGLDLVVIKIDKNLGDFWLEGNRLVAQAGASLTEASKKAIFSSLTGMEGLSGIPGNIGGAVAMNAGAYGTEVKDVMESCKVMDKEGNIFDIKVEDMDLDYRMSRALTQGLIVLEATFLLEKGDQEKIISEYEKFRDLRISKQPLDKPSGGSTFKRPKGHYASKLIEDAGLKGYTYKNAGVSAKHAGFVIANPPSKCEDVLMVIDHVEKTVKEKFGVDLEPEVRILGIEDEDS